jgi:hypothetical protein
MPIFKKPTFSKKTSAKGEVQTCYVFHVEQESKDEPLECMIESADDLHVTTLQAQLDENREWLLTMINTFLQTHRAMFSKAYTADSMYKVVKHVIEIQVMPDTFPCIALFFPSMFEVLGGTFYIKWSYTIQSVLIDIPVPIDAAVTDKCTVPSPPTLPVLKHDGLMEEVNMDDIPLDTHATDTKVEASIADRQADRNRIKEARLKSRIAMYRVQIQLRQYYEKYGEEYDDSEYDTDNFSSDEDEVEEIQL